MPTAAWSLALPEQLAFPGRNACVRWHDGPYPWL